jgi:hypothetical protein
MQVLSKKRALRTKLDVLKCLFIFHCRYNKCYIIITFCYFTTNFQIMCLIYVICVCLRIMVFNTYCVVLLFCFSSSCGINIASFSLYLSLCRRLLVVFQVSAPYKRMGFTLELNNRTLVFNEIFLAFQIDPIIQEIPGGETLLPRWR